MSMLSIHKSWEADEITGDVGVFPSLEVLVLPLLLCDTLGPQLIAKVADATAKVLLSGLDSSRATIIKPLTSIDQEILTKASMYAEDLWCDWASGEDFRNSSKYRGNSPWSFLRHLLGVCWTWAMQIG